MPACAGPVGLVIRLKAVTARVGQRPGQPRVIVDAERIHVGDGQLPEPFQRAKRIQPALIGQYAAERQCLEIAQPSERFE